MKKSKNQKKKTIRKQNGVQKHARMWRDGGSMDVFLTQNKLL